MRSYVKTGFIFNPLNPYLHRKQRRHLRNASLIEEWIKDPVPQNILSQAFHTSPHQGFSFSCSHLSVSNRKRAGSWYNLSQKIPRRHHYPRSLEPPTCPHIYLKGFMPDPSELVTAQKPPPGSPAEPEEINRCGKNLNHSPSWHPHPMSCPHWPQHQLRNQNGKGS